MKKGDEDYFSQKLRVRIKDNKNSPHGKFHRFLFSFSSKFWDLNFSSYVLYIYLCYVTCHTRWAWVTYDLLRTTTTTRYRQWPTKQLVENNESQLLVPSLPEYLYSPRSYYISCHISSVTCHLVLKVTDTLTDWLTDWQTRSASDLGVCMQSIRPQECQQKVYIKLSKVCQSHQKFASDKRSLHARKYRRRFKVFVDLLDSLKQGTTSIWILMTPWDVGSCKQCLGLLSLLALLV